MGTLQPTHELFSEQIRDSNLGNVTRIQPMGGGVCENEPVQSADSCDKSGRELWSGLAKPSQNIYPFSAR